MAKRKTFLSALSVSAQASAYFLLHAGSMVAQADVVCTGNCQVANGDFVSVAQVPGGDGNLLIDDGDVVTAPNGVSFGNVDGVNATVLLSGAGTLLESGGANNFVFIGSGLGTASATIDDGASMIVNGRVDPDNFSSAQMLIGIDGGDGELTLSNGGSLLLREPQTGGGDSTSLVVGRPSTFPGGRGVLNVDGIGSVVTLNGVNAVIHVVDREFPEGSGVQPASGELNVTNGGRINIAPVSGGAALRLARDIGTASALVDGAGSRITVFGQTAGSVVVGAQVDDSDPITSTALLEVVNSGVLEIGGAATDFSSSLSVGTGRAEGRVRVANGGIVSIGGFFGSVDVGDNGLIEADNVFLGSPDVPGFGQAPGIHASNLNGSGIVRVADTVRLTTGGGLGVFARSPGDADTLQIDGNFVSEQGSFLGIGALEDGTGSTVSISGTATLNGGFVNVFAPDGEWSVARTYTILSADGGVVGEFDGAFSFLDYLAPTLAYTDTTVQLTLERLGAAVQEAILEESNAQELSINTRTVNTILQTQINTTIGASFRSAATPAAPATVYHPGSVATGLSAGDDPTSGNVWLNFTPSTYESQSVLPGSNVAQDIDGDGWNLLLGVDQLIGDRVVAGFFTGAEASDVKFDAIRGEQENDGFMLGTYAGLSINEHFYVSVNGNYTWLSNSIEEQAFESTQKIEGDYNSERYTVGADLNGTVALKQFDVRGQLGYTYTQEDYDDYRTSLGDRARPKDQKLGRLRAAVDTTYMGKRFQPFLSIAYEYDEVSTVPERDDDGWVIFAGLRTAAASRLSLEGYVSTLQGRKNEDHYMLGLNLHYAL